MKKLLAFIFLLMSLSSFSQKNEIIYLWPGKVPGEPKEKQPPVMDKPQNDNVVRIAEVTNPAIEVFLADPAKNNQSAVIVCPVGAYRILAYDKE
jgi:hypothetical protein